MTLGWTTSPRPNCHVLVERTMRTRPSPHDILAFSKCRNERLRLPAFLEHYRGLGVDRFFIVDNDSSDGTTEYLSSQPDVQLFRTAKGFREAGGGTDWLNALLGEFGVGSWCVAVDIDELLIYPGSETASLRMLTEYLADRRCEALGCLLLDLYPADLLNERDYLTAGDVVAAAPYFDAGPYDRVPVDRCPGVFITGGMRARVFYPEFRARTLAARIYGAAVDRAANRWPRLHDTRWLRARQRHKPPCLTKVPLVRWDPESRYFNLHWVSRKAVAPETGVLLHCKFLQDFRRRAVEEAARGEYYAGAAEYRRYAATLSANPDLTFMYEGSTRFEGTDQLVRLGLMQDTEAWAGARSGRSR